MMQQCLARVCQFDTDFPAVARGDRRRMHRWPRLSVPADAAISLLPMAAVPTLVKVGAETQRAGGA
jgi:hypothetical protein